MYSGPEDQRSHCAKLDGIDSMMVGDGDVTMDNGDVTAI